MSWMMDRFLCCCVNTVGNADHVGALSGELLGHSGGHEVSYPLDSASPQFPMDSKLPNGEFDGGANTARSNMSAGSASHEGLAPHIRTHLKPYGMLPGLPALAPL